MLMSAVFVLTVMTCTFGIAASAETDTAAYEPNQILDDNRTNCDGIQFSFDVGKKIALVVSADIAEGNGDIVIPGTVLQNDGCEYTVVTIYDDAFRDNVHLTSLVMPDSVTYIGPSAFDDCTSLVSVTVSKGLKTLYPAFDGCTSLENIYLSDIAAWCNVGLSYDYSSPMYYASNVYLNGELVTELVIPSSVKEIGNFSFFGWDKLESVTVPLSVTRIGYYAFAQCTSLKDVDLPNTLRTITGGIFEGCTALESIVIPDSVTYIGGYVFRNCTSLTSVTVPSTLTDIGTKIFYGCSALESIVLPDALTIIRAETFRYCDKLRDITIPDGVTQIGKNAFSQCYALTEVTALGYTGGIAGKSDYHSGIHDCYNTGTLSKSVYVGGIAAYMYYARITCCYNIGELRAVSGISSSCCGGVVGIIQAGNSGYTVLNSYCSDYYSYAATGITHSASVLTDEQMKTASSYAGFDFGKTWVMSQESGYPVLLAQQ